MVVRRCTSTLNHLFLQEFGVFRHTFIDLVGPYRALGRGVFILVGWDGWVKFVDLDIRRLQNLLRVQISSTHTKRVCFIVERWALLFNQRRQVTKIKFFLFDDDSVQVSLLLLFMMLELWVESLHLKQLIVLSGARALVSVQVVFYKRVVVLFVAI